MIKTLPSGAELDITIADFDDAHNLFQSFLRESSNLGVNSTTFTDNLLAVKLLSSKEFSQCIWPCMQKATYNKVKISKDLFENEKAREDYVIIAKEVMEFNLTPFFKSLGLKS